MAIEDTPVYEEIIKIFQDTPKPLVFEWSCIVIFPEEEYTPIKLINLDIKRDYLNNFGDETYITLVIPDGTFNNLFVRHKNNIIFELTRTPIYGTEEGEEPILTKKYRAILTDTNNDIVSSDRKQSQDPELDDLSNIRERTFQLMDITLEKIRIFQTGSIYKNSIPGDVINYILTNTSRFLDLPEEDSILGVDIVEPDNLTINKHIIIPHGSNLEDIPTIIQEEWGGVYNTGIGNYLQDRLWFVWPLYNTKRYDLEKRTLRIYNLPSYKYPGIEKSWRLDGTEIIVLSSGETTFTDLSYNEQLNLGNGTRFTSGDQVWSGFDTVDKTADNKYIPVRADNNTEIKSILRKDFDYAPVSPKRITNNKFSEASRLSRRLGSLVSLVWESAKIDEIYPGMPVKLIYTEADEVMEVFGTVIGTHYFIYNDKPSASEEGQVTNASINVFIEKIIEE